VGEDRFDASSVLDIQWAGGKIQKEGITEVVFEGDTRALKDIAILAGVNYGEDTMGKGVPLPKELSYLRMTAASPLQATTMSLLNILITLRALPMPVQMGMRIKGLACRVSASGKTPTVNPPASDAPRAEASMIPPSRPPLSSIQP
jgi:hypothetical protein